MKKSLELDDAVVLDLKISETEMSPMSYQTKQRRDKHPSL